MNFFSQLFDAERFMPHAHCYLWDPGLMRLHFISDVLIAAAYFTIPFTLVHFVRKRRDLPFDWMFVCFGVFIVACGMTHVMEVITLWKPYYWLSGIIKAITAAASVPTAILLVRLIPAALSIPGPAVLRAANEALIEQTKVLNLIVTNMGDGLLVVDRDGNSLLSNPATRRMLGLAQDEDVPDHCAGDCGFYRADKTTPLPAAESPTTRAVAGENVDGEIIFIRHGTRANDGSWADVTARPLRDEHGAIHGAVAVFRDITGHKRAEEQQQRLQREQAARVEAEAANSAKDKFLAMLGHELRTPLTPILAGIELLEQQQGNGNGDLRTTVEIIRRNVELEARLIDDILDLSAIARGKINLDLATIDLHMTLQSAVDIFRGEIGAKRLRLDLDLNASEHFVRGDHARLMQVFWNVIKNAIKFTAEAGAICIRSFNEDERIVVEVRDNGIGIDPEFMPRIFDAFEQGVRRVQAGQGGLGLGLAIARAILGAHGGRIEARSAGRGHGTLVQISLETAPTPTLAQPQREPRGAANLAATKLRILLVDDHRDTVNTLGTLLRRLGYDVVCAETAETARHLARGREFDLLVTDIGLPDASGHELMRDIGKRQSIPGIALSGFGMEEDVEKSRAAGFVDHLIKPVDVNRLQAALKEITRR
ncbi:MAG: response regulator [Verrucomicrobia bacterium]|nr:response regulator [Verrucomicrobiota bacterium]